MYQPSTNNIHLVEPNGQGLTNTIGRAELASIAAALIHGYTHVATDSLASLHQIRKQLLYPEKHRHHVQGDVLDKIANILRNSHVHISLYKVKSHAGIAGNECADAIAKYQASQTDTNTADTIISNRNPDGNPFSDIAWLASESPNRSTQTPALTSPPLSNLSLAYLSNLHDALKCHMHTKHKLGGANPKTGYYSYYQALLPFVNKSISNTFWTMPQISLNMKLNIFKYRTGTLFNQKHAVRFKISSSPHCPLCHQTDSALHILSGCQHTTISNMITERHNIACRLIMKALSKASLGACIVSMDIGSKDRLAQENLQIPENTTNRMVPKWLFPPNFSDKNRLTCSRPDAIIVTAKPLNTSSASPRQVPNEQRTTKRAGATIPPQAATHHKPLRPQEYLNRGGTSIC